MLPRPHRLHKTKDIELVLKKGRGFFGEFFQGRFLQTTDTTRITFIVSSKIAKKATRRNWLKRRMRAQSHLLLPILPQGDYVISAKKGSDKLTKNLFNETFKTFLSKNSQKLSSSSYKYIPKNTLTGSRNAEN